LSHHCGNGTIGVEHIASISATFRLCEIRNSTEYGGAGRFKNQWSCGCIVPGGVDRDRSVAYMVEVSTTQPGSVQWTLSAGLAAS
jgi:hypothetical protein